MFYYCFLQQPKFFKWHGIEYLYIVNMTLYRISKFSNYKSGMRDCLHQWHLICIHEKIKRKVASVGWIVLFIEQSTYYKSM